MSVLIEARDTRRDYQAVTPCEIQRHYSNYLRRLITYDSMSEEVNVLRISRT